MRIFFCLSLVFLLLGCGEKVENERNSEPSTEMLGSSTIQVESEGDFDPIANSKAVKGGTYTTWGSSFPKSLNMFLDYNSFSFQTYKPQELLNIND